MVRYIPDYELSIIIRNLDEAHRKLEKALIRKKEAQKRMHKITARNAIRFKKMRKECCFDGNKLNLLCKNAQTVINEYSDAFKKLSEATDNYKSIKLNLMITTGVPEKYHNSSVIERTNKRSINIFFGGKDGPFGANHGHYVITDSGIMTYRREYGEEHGSHHHYPEGYLIYTNCGDVI